MQASTPIYLQVSPSNTNSKMRQDLTQIIAAAVIERLHSWCVQLMITIYCVMSCLADEEENQNERKNQKSTNSARNSRKNLADIEMTLLRHLTSPQMSRHRPVDRSSKKRASRPPSPQLFDILEETE